jgi:hypothetical protein
MDSHLERRSRQAEMLAPTPERSMIPAKRLKKKKRALQRKKGHMSQIKHPP